MTSSVRDYITKKIQNSKIYFFENESKAKLQTGIFGLKKELSEVKPKEEPLKSTVSQSAARIEALE